MTEASPAQPVANLLVIRSDDIHRAVDFYRMMGMKFDRHSHGSGPEHYASEAGGFVFEIYPRKNESNGTRRTRFGFRVGDVDCVVSKLEEVQATVVSEPVDTEWGRRAVVRDFDGHTVELVTPIDREKKSAS